MLDKISPRALLLLLALMSASMVDAHDTTADLNPCATAKCENFAKCVPSSIFNYTCECNNYWTGEFCQLPSAQNPCFSSPCKQDSKCLLDIPLNAYKCICQPGYTGPACDIMINVCESFPCMNKGFCSNINKMGIRQADYYRCSCVPGFTGLHCEVEINYCESQPCLNSGICIPETNSYSCICPPMYQGNRCEMDLNNATCSCRPGFYGPTCGIEINGCAGANPCNNGVCINRPSGNRTYTCSCFPSQTGENCEIELNLCSSYPCHYGGICEQTSITDYTCKCPLGTLGKNCDTNINECFSRPCQNNGTCVEPALNLYRCICPDNFIGPNCEIRLAVCEVNVCQNGGICSVGDNGISCLCLSGFTGSRCEISLDPCLSNPCMNNGTCFRALNNTFKCICPLEYNGALCDLQYDACSFYNPCQNGATCDLVNSEYRCTCPQFYSGKYCQDYSSICETNPCNNGTCYERDVVGNYTCFCDRGYAGPNCDILLNSCSSNPCKNNGLCNPLVDNYNCICPPGWTSKRCEVEINACESSPCLNGGLCTNAFNFYNCTCRPGWLGSVCQIPVDPCASISCANGGLCENIFGKPYCKCPENFYGANCQQKIDFCLSRPCQNAGFCTSTPNGFNCTCLAGFSGETCEMVQDLCVGYCQNNGTCFENAELIVGCDCPCEYTGARCETRRDLCAINMCKNGGSCVADGCQSKCECPCGFTGEFCDVAINACVDGLGNATSRCLNGGVCRNNNCNFTCECTAGFTGALCQIPVNTCNPNQCQNDAICVPYLNDYQCVCPCSQYSGKNCEIYDDICQTRGSECLNGGSCVAKGCDIQCACPPDWTGARCQQRANPCTYNLCFNNATCIANQYDDTFKCVCTPQYTGSVCLTPVVITVTTPAPGTNMTTVAPLPCSSSPCGLGKFCQDIDSTNYTCACPPNYTGARCEVRVKACDARPCRGGMCMENYITGGFICNCALGTTGERCETDVNPCNSNPCQNSGTCRLTGLNRFVCDCAVGTTGTICEALIDPCQSYPCWNGGQCSRLSTGAYECNCNGTCFSGQNCEIPGDSCENKNCGTGTCLSTGKCTSKCVCPPGSNFSANSSTCYNPVDICASNPCMFGGTCVSIEGANRFYCTCPVGFTGTRCSTRLVACSSDPCQNGGFCIENANDSPATNNTYGFTCVCQPGWTGPTCDDDINECAAKPCQNNGLCVEQSIDSYSCFCKFGYTGANCETLIDICSSNPCLNSLNCSSVNGTLDCSCKPGFYGVRCELEVNECLSMPCANGGICINKIDGYECKCPVEYAGERCNQTSCNSYCYNGGSCVQNNDGPYCVCAVGFEGPRCEKINNPCLSNPCRDNQGKCISAAYGHFTCECFIGFTGSLCETAINVCSPSPCIRGECYSDTPGITKCRCPEGYTGRFCETSVQVCAAANPCQNGGTCNTPFFLQGCPSGLTGPNCGVIIDTCASNPCQSPDATCVQTRLNEYKCVCPPYLTGNLCQTKINPCDSRPCVHGITCVQTSFLDYKCLCPPGFTGPTCGERFDVCQSNPCLNGDCVAPNPGTYRCSCHPGFKGPHCDESVFICDYRTCLNGGYCVGNTTISLDASSCICPNGYTGRYCEAPIDVCANQANPTDLCGANGVCHYSAPGQHHCRCKNECYFGDSCQNSTDPCDAKTCRNGGACVGDKSTCTSTCSCQAGFTGENCEINLDPCLNSNCMNGGTCVQNSTTSFTCACTANFQGPDCGEKLDLCANYTCENGGLCHEDNNYYQPHCLCQYGFTGLHCENTIDFCYNKPCLNDGVCESGNSTYSCNCTSGFVGQRCQGQVDECALKPCVYGSCFSGSAGSYKCLCHNGWTGSNCDVQIDFCTSNPCQNGNCTGYQGGYSCKCESGFQGKDCDQPINRCAVNPCQHGTCSQTNTTNPATNSTYSCACDAGYEGANCQQVVDLCPSTNCSANGTCRQLSPFFAYCDCDTGYRGKKCETVVDSCALNTCYNGGTCNQTSPGQFTCQCITGFTGTFCEFQQDMCLPNPCENGATCTSSAGSYQCQCPANFEGPKCQFAQICTAQENPCQNGAVCKKNVDSSFDCTCNPGFTGKFCETVIDACNSSPCQNGASCFRFNFTEYVCSCPVGFSGQNCENDINECSLNPCQNNGQCVNTFGTYSCVCPIGFAGKDCEQTVTDPCLFNSCSANGTDRCVATENGFGYECKCKPSYGGVTCNSLIPPCMSNPCSNGATCVANVNQFTCVCPIGRTGANCETEINYCVVNNPCGGFGTCTNTPSNYTCTCFTGFSGRNCEIKLDTCSSQPCQNGATCVAGTSQYTCMCTDEFEGTNCENKVDPCLSYACYNGGTCTTVSETTFCRCAQGFGGPQCQFNIGCQLNCQNGGTCNEAGNMCLCPSDWTGLECTVSLNACLSNPCQNGAQCNSTSSMVDGKPVNAYTCACSANFTGANCETRLTACSSKPCLNDGVCKSDSLTNHTCTCFSPYFGANCENKLSLCSFLSCGQGQCVVSADGYNASCVCNEGWIGANCNLQPSACLSSPCRNGAQCLEVVGGGYTCNCTDEYEGPTCETAKTCVQSFDYCSSMPCLNGGVCTPLKETCSFTCKCDNQISYGEFCQFSIAPNVFTGQGSVNVLSSDVVRSTIFNQEVRPCLTSAWQQANPQFACPQGYEIIPGITGCFKALAKTKDGFNRANSEYECSLTGGSLVALETEEKSNAIKAWLKDTVKTTAKYFWLNTATRRDTSTPFSGNWTWLWISTQNNSYAEFGYDNWGSNQSTNFNGDSVYLATKDYKLYVAVGKDAYFNGTESIGVLCETTKNSLTKSQINVVLTEQSQAYTLAQQTADQFKYTVNITLSGSIKASEVKEPTLQLITSELATCGKTVLNASSSELFTKDSTFSVDICGADLSSNVNSDQFNKLLSSALLKAWLRSRPEFTYCSQNRNCVKINVLNTEKVALDASNAVMRIRYVIRVNSVLISPSDPDAFPPNAAMLQEFVNALPRNNFENFLLCGVKNESLVASLPQAESFFGLTLNKFIFDSPAMVDSLKSAIKMAIKNVSSSLDEAQMRVEFNNDHESLYPVRSMPYSMDDIHNQPIRNTFKLFYQNKTVSHATQSLFLESKFLEALQSKIASDDKLSGVSVASFANHVGVKHLFEITLKGRLRHLANVVSNSTFLEVEKAENIKYKKFIADEKIEFNFCKKCYLTPSKYSLVLIGSEIGVDSTSARCYFHYFAVKYEDEFTGAMRLARITEEVKLMEAIKKVKPQLQMTANSEITLFLANRTVSMGEMPPTRRYADAVHLQLTQSLLSEDVSEIVATIKSAVQPRPNSLMPADFIVQYWGQSEFIKDTKGNGVSITYWQPLFYVVNPTSGIVFKPKFDFTVNHTAINSFLVSFNSSRLNFYGSSLPFDKENDYIISDLFKLPCYGQTFVQTYTVIMQIMQNEWTKYFQANNLNEAATTISLQTFSSFSLPYVSYKGYFSVLPFGIRTAHGMITPDVFSGPLLSNLKTAMSGFCDIQDPIDQISRQASLNYVQASGYLTIDQANEYIPSITAAYETFFASFSYPVKIEKPTVIRSIENRFVNQIIVTRIYYQLFGNTSQPLNAFNYQIKTTRFTIQPPSNLAPLVKRSLRIMNEARVDLLNKERITDLDTMLDTLPQIAIDSEITEDQKQGLVDSLKKFWTTELRGRGQQVNSIEVQLGTTQKYINTQTSSHVTYVYYIMAIDGVVHLRDNLPELNTESETKLNTELHTNGFSLSRGPYVKTRTIFIDADSATVAFNEGEALNSIKSAWIQYLSASDVSVISSNINIWWIDQNIYYDLNKPFIGIRYAITLNKQDPSKIPVPDPSKDYFEPFFQPFKVYGGTPFKARRLYVFSSIIKDIAQFKNVEYMKNKISEIWDAKNPLTDPTYKQSTYITPFFATSNNNLYGNVQNSPIVRATYTQSINGLEPLALFHKNPTEDDFSAQFLNPLLDPLITRICFDKCYNYQQSQIYINKKFISDTQSVQKLINALVASWNEVNQVTSNLLKRNKINIKTIQNNKKNHQRSLVSDKSQQKQVVFNIEIENPNSDTQIDATDLIMPSEAVILKNLQIEFPTITQEDLLPVEITTTTTPVPTTTVAASTTQVSATTESSINSAFQKKLEWWEGLLIGVGVICFAAIVITSLVVCCKRRGIRRSLLSNAGSSSGSSTGGRKAIKDQFAHLASTFPQGNADFNGIITRNSFENKQYAGSVRSNASSMNPSELRFVPSARPSVSKNSQNLAVFYPGVPIESIVPNPVFVNNQSNSASNILNAGIYENPRLNLALEDSSAPGVEKLVTSVYVTRQKSMKNSGKPENSESNEECYENQ